jgi:hypothetical protein
MSDLVLGSLGSASFDLSAMLSDEPDSTSVLASTLSMSLLALLEKLQSGLY